MFKFHIIGFLNFYANVVCLRKPDENAGFELNLQRLKILKKKISIMKNTDL